MGTNLGDAAELPLVSEQSPTQSGVDSAPKNATELAVLLEQFQASFVCGGSIMVKSNRVPVIP